jgi:hypothetical protein
MNVGAVQVEFPSLRTPDRAGGRCKTPTDRHRQELMLTTTVRFLSGSDRSPATSPATGFRGASRLGARQTGHQAEPSSHSACPPRAGFHQAILEDEDNGKAAAEAAYRVKAAKTKAPIITAHAKAIRASKNLAI